MEKSLTFAFDMNLLLEYMQFGGLPKVVTTEDENEKKDIGTLTNPHKIQNTFRSVKQSSITQDTILRYLQTKTDSCLWK